MTKEEINQLRKKRAEEKVLIMLRTKTSWLEDAKADAAAVLEVAIASYNDAKTAYEATIKSGYSCEAHLKKLYIKNIMDAAYESYEDAKDAALRMRI